MQLDQYRLTQRLGKGTFGEVFLTTKQGTNQLYATKRMSSKLALNENYLKYFNNEISILRQLHHNNIIKLEELKRTTNNFYIITEYCNGGSLTQCLETFKNIYHKPFTEEIVQHIMRQIMSAVKYMHDLKIIHRDLKLDNILVNFNDETDKNTLNLLKAEVKIIDFGFAAFKEQNGNLKSAVGSPMNMDPSLLHKFSSGGKENKDLGVDERADIWSLGILCYQMLIGNCPFDAYNMPELLEKIDEGTYKIPTDLSYEVVSFLNGMLQYNPQKRLNASELSKHAFLVKSVHDFKRINLNKVSKKVYGGELNINIRENKTIWNIFNEEDERQLNNIPGNFLPEETPISESQYIDDIDQTGKKNGYIIGKNPFEEEKRYFSNEFTMTNSTKIPVEGNEEKPYEQRAININDIPQSRSSPIPEFVNNLGNQNINAKNNINGPVLATNLQMNSPKKTNENRNYIPQLRTPQMKISQENPLRNAPQLNTGINKGINPQIVQNPNLPIKMNLITKFVPPKQANINNQRLLINQVNQPKGNIVGINMMQKGQSPPNTGPIINNLQALKKYKHFNTFNNDNNIIINKNQQPRGIINANNQMMINNIQLMNQPNNQLPAQISPQNQVVIKRAKTKKESAQNLIRAQKLGIQNIDPRNIHMQNGMNANRQINVVQRPPLNNGVAGTHLMNPLMAQNPALGMRIANAPINNNISQDNNRRIIVPINNRNIPVQQAKIINQKNPQFGKIQPRTTNSDKYLAYVNPINNPPQPNMILNNKRVIQNNAMIVTPNGPVNARVLNVNGQNNLRKLTPNIILVPNQRIRLTPELPRNYTLPSF